MTAPVSYADQLECAERELRLRRRVYPRRVQDGRMSQGLADRELRLMEAIIETLGEMAKQERLL